MKYSCYLCTKEVAQKDPKAKNKTTHGERVKPLENYRSVDVYLTNGDYTVVYATPVCDKCLGFLTADKTHWEELASALIKMIKDHPPHAEFDDLTKDGKAIYPIAVKDLTDTLKAEGVISCQ